MSSIANTSRSDTLGAFASGLCLAHCVATPFIFVAHAGVSTHGHGHASPQWWGFIDIFFLVVSFLAVVWSARKSSKKWIGYLLVASWLGLAFVVLNEKAGWLHLLEEAIYLPALALVGLHLYNRRYCQCSNEGCCEALPSNSQGS